MAPSASDALTTAFDAQSIGELQSQLRAMSYNEPVGIDSAPLVHHLLTDLIKASEARQLDNLKTEKAQRDVNELSQILLTLREENARLTRENNSLHLEKIHQEEAIAEREQACEVQLEGLRDDIKKLQLLYSQKSQQCTHKEKELAKLQEQLTLGKAIAPHSSVSMGKQTLKQLHLDDEQVTEVQQSQQQAQESIEQQDQLTQLTKENEKLRFQCHQFNEKLAKREQEIERLSKLAVQDFKETDSSLKEMKSLEDRDQMEAQQEKMELQVAQLSTQVNTLKDQVIMYEGRLQEATEQNSWQDDLAEKLKDAELDREHLLNELNMRQANHHVLEEEYLRCENEHRERENLSISESPNVETNKCKKQDHETNLDSLKEQVNMLSTHKDRLEDALRSMHYDKIAYTNALLNADSQNGALTSDLAHAEAKLEELHKVKAKLEESLSDAQSSLITHTRKLDVLRESLKQSEDKCALGNEKNTSLHQDLRSMDQLLSHRDDELRYLNHELLVQKEELERLYNRLDGLEAAIEDVESDDEALVGRNALFAREIKWLEEERHNLCREKEELMLQVMKLEDELRKAKTSSEEAEHNCKKYLEKINMASTMQTNLESKLKTKKRECLDVQRQLVESTEKSRELADKQQQAQILLHRAEETENERTVIQNEALALKRHVEELRDQNACLKNRVDNDEIYAKRLMNQSQKLQSDFTLASKKCSTLEKDKEDLQHKYDDAMVELRTARQTWHHYQNEFEKLTQEVQAQQHSLSSGQDALQSSQSSISELKNQVRQLQSESKLRQSNFQQLETRLEQEKLSHKSVQAQVLLLQDELLQVKETNRAREIALKQLREDIQSKDRDLTEKTEALENFKLLIEQMESSRDQMVFQMKQRQQQIQRHQQELDDLNAKIGSLESDVLAKNSEISTLKKLTRALDSEKDAVNDQLDALTEKCHEMEEQNNELRKTLQSKISDATGMQEQLTNCIYKLNEVEDKASHLQEHCSELESQVGHLEQMKGVHTAELAALAQDLENMTVENQAISEECTRLQHSEHSRFQSTKNMKQTIRGIERERDTLQIELDDLRHTYRSLIQEHEGMQKARREVSVLQEELAIVNESLRKQVATLENQLEVLREKNSKLACESAAYRDQVSFLTEKLQTNKEKEDELRDRLQQIENELDAQKQVATEISAQRYGAQAENAAVSQRIIHLEAKLSNSKYEMKTLQDKLHAEQAQRRSLEEVASNLRQKIANNETIISRFEKQRNAMAQEIQALHQRRLSASNSVMEMSDFNHSPSSIKPSSHTSTQDGNGGKSVQSCSSSRSPSVSPASNVTGSSPDSAQKASSSSSFLPLHALEEAQIKCQELEDRLVQQDVTIKQLERSRSKFKRFAAKYEREIEQRDRRIEELQTSSHASSFVSPDVEMYRSRQFRSSSSLSSSGSSVRQRENVRATASR